MACFVPICLEENILPVFAPVLPDNGAVATLAFLVVLRVLISDFFWIDIAELLFIFSSNLDSGFPWVAYLACMLNSKSTA